MKKNLLEWGVFCLSLMIIGSVVVLLAMDARQTPKSPPDIFVSVGEPSTSTGHYRVPLQIENRGGTTAEGVMIEAILTTDKGEEKAEFEVQFLPRKSMRHGWVTFKTNPVEGKLEARAVGWEKP